MNRMKSAMVPLAVLSACSVFAASPEISDVTMSGSGRIVIGYKLSGEPAVVTLDIQTNGVSVGQENVQTLSDDVGVKVMPGTRQIVWRSHHDIPNLVLANAQAVVTAWPTNDPPPYLVADLTKGGNPDVRYYASASALPGGPADERYRTTRLLMRKIPASGVVWTMGSPATETGRNSTNENAHAVVLTRDYYIGVYPITQGQYTNVVEAFPSPMAFEKLENSPLRPMNYLSYSLIRGVSPTIDWPTTGSKVSSASTIQAFRTRTGLLLDLPTEAQWEFACRAGARAAYYNGAETYANGAIDDISWNKDNVDPITFKISETSSDYTARPGMPVGTRAPNAFGLYDMSGNVTEFCRDWFANYELPAGGGVTVDPVGPATGTARINRGGSDNSSDINALRSAARSWGTEGGQRGWNNGFRFVAPADTDAFETESEAATRTVSHSFTIAAEDAPMIVTLDDIEADGVSVGAENFRDDVFGEINAKLPAGTHTLYWRADRSFPDHRLAAGKIAFKLSFWKPETPPDYMVADLFTSNSIAYYSSTNTLPGGVDDFRYRSERIVMRRIPAKDVIWRMGSDSSEAGSESTRDAEIPHYVKLLSDYYISIYQVTLRQFYNINGGWQSDYTSFTNCVDYESLPMNYIGYNTLRGSFANNINWPSTGSKVLKNSTLDKMRRCTGVLFDIPTDAEWEYACRAGTGTAFNNGKNLTSGESNEFTDGTLAKDYYWFYGSTTNVWDAPSPSSTPDQRRAPMPVNTMPPNSWGIYNMPGNGNEWVRDAFASGAEYYGTFSAEQAEKGFVTDPKGLDKSTSDGLMRTLRSATPTANPVRSARSAYRKGTTAGDRSFYYTFRVVCPIGVTE